jgi:hypothetical protein
MAMTLGNEVRPDRAAAMMDAHPELAVRMERLEARRAASAQTLDAAWQELRDARAAKLRADTILDEIEDAAAAGQLQAPPRPLVMPTMSEPPLEGGVDTARLERARLAAKAAAARVERATAAQEAATAVWEDAARLQATCERYLNRVERYEPAASSASPKRGESAVDAVTRVRREIASLEAESRRVANAPSTRDEVRRRIRQSIELTAQQSTPIMVGRDGVRWPISLVGGRPQTDALALLALMFPDRMAEIAEAAVPDAPDAIGEAERVADLARIEDKALALARDEEALISHAEEQGFAQLRRRGDADARAVLCLSGAPMKN